MSDKNLLLIIEYGIYPALVKGLAEHGFTVQVEHLMRNAMRSIKKNPPDIVLAEFFHNPDFRDRVSNLESLLAQLQNTQIKTAVFYALQQQEFLDKVMTRFSIDLIVPQPVDVGALAKKLHE